MNRSFLLTSLATTSESLFPAKAPRHKLPAMAFIVCCVLVGSAVSARAQSPNVQHTENRADQSMRGNLKVDPSTLGMSFSIPLGGYPGRGGNHVPVTLNYNSKLWRIDFDSTMPWLNQNRTWTRAKYAETSTSGWTSSLEIPFIEYTGRSQFYDAAGNSICSLCPEETRIPITLSAFMYTSPMVQRRN